MAATLDPKLNTGRNPYQQSKPASATTSAITAAVQSAKPVTLPKLPFQTSRSSLAPTVQKSTAPTAPDAPAPVTNAPATTAPTTTAPATGALNYNTATTAQKQGMQDNWARLNSDSDYLASEISRAQAKIASNQAAGLSTDAQNDYLTRLTGIASGSSTPGAPGTGGQANQSYASGLGLPPELSWLGASGNSEIAQEIEGYRQRQEAARLAAQAGVDANNQYLAEQIDALQKQRAVDLDSLQQQQNRFGGLYSGGLNYQGGQINSSYANQQGALSRDIAARNAQLMDQYGSQANSIAEQIQELQSNAPGILRDRIQSYLDNYANTYGYNPLNPNQSTQAGKNANWNAYLGATGLTGNTGIGPTNNWSSLISNGYNGRPTYEANQQAYENAYNEQRDTVADKQWMDEFNYRAQQDGIQNALQWAQERRITANQARSGGSGGSSSGGKSSSGSSQGVIVDPNQPRTATTMETWIINNLPGGPKTQGPPSPNQLETIENYILGNPNLSEKDIIKLYQRFGIPLPE